MWVWRGLGYENVIELPSGALGALGRRCRRRGATCCSPRWALAGGPRPGEAPAETPALLSDEEGETLELYPAVPSSPGTTATSTYRLAPLEKLRLCIPGAVELHPAPAPAAESRGGGAYGSLLHAITGLVAQKGGYFTWQVPMVDARLRPDIADECCYTPAPEDWPLCVVGAIFGAALEIAVTAPWPPEGSPSRRSLWVPPENGPLKEVPPVPCEGFQIQISQHGGPPLDPRRLNNSSEERVAEELERWVSKCLAARPDTWVTLYVATEPGEVQASLLAPMPAPGAAARRQTGDVVVAVAAETEVGLEPFELSYGDAHISSLRRMLEDEVAHVLGIPAERVLCGDFVQVSGSRDGVPRRRHVRHDTIGLRFALLHAELVDLVQARELPRRPAAAGLPRPRGLLDRSTAERLEAMNATVKFGATSQSMLQPCKDANHTLKAAGAAMTQLAAMSQSKYATKSKWGGATLSTSSSAPALGAPAAAAGTLLVRSDATLTGGQDLPPDLLLKRLVSALSEGKHPLRRHPDIFPMLSRVVGSVRMNAMLVVDRNMVTPGKMADGLKALMKGRTNIKRELEMDPETRSKLTTMRSEILRIYAEPGGEVVAQQRQLTGLSAKELLDEMEGSISRPTDLQAALQMMLVHTEKDVEWCLRLRSHKAVERVLALARRFNSERAVVSRAVGILSNLTLNDVGCIDRFLEKHLAPDFIQTLENFPQDQQIQFSGCQVLRRLYIRAREVASHGPRVVCLGKNLSEVWTFKGLERILATMRLFGDSADIQVECFTLLASLAELLHNNGMAVDTFNILEVVMRRHAARPDILAKGVLIIARLGPSFLTHDPRGVFSIIQAMARHRSHVEVQRVAMRALVALAKEEKALHCCRTGGSVGATVAAMAAHSRDERVLREGMIALERHCPRGLTKVIRICGDIAAVLPPVSWNEYGNASRWEPALLDGQWDPDLVKMFREDIATKPRRLGNGSTPAGAEDEEEGGKEKEAGSGGAASGAGGGLAAVMGYRHSGLREEFDAADSVWATSLTARGRSETRERDIRVLKQQGCDAEGLRAPGPSSEQLRRLCEALRDGLAQQYSAQDGELLAGLIGHFAWCSASAAREVFAFGGALALVAWLSSPRFAKGCSPEESALAYPMQRVCLGALSSLCQHDEELASQVLVLGGANLALEYADHVDQRTQRAAMRLLARLLPVAGGRPPRERGSGSRSGSEDSSAPSRPPKAAKEHTVSTQAAWRLILRELRGPDEISRTCAAACAMEAVEGGWASEEGAPVDALAVGILSALDRAVRVRSSPAGLPLLLVACQLLGDPEEDYACARVLLRCQGQGEGALRQGKALVQLLAFWLPKGIASGALAADKGAATAAANALQSLSEFEAPLPFREMRELMVCGQSTNAEPAFREACKGALLMSVDRENQPQQLAHLFATSVGKGRDNEERLADIRILRSIAQRIVHLLRSNPGQATDVLLAALRKAEPLVPKEPKDDSAAVLALLAETRTFAVVAPLVFGAATEGAGGGADREADAGLGDSCSSLPLLGPAGSRPSMVHSRTSPPQLLVA